VPLLTRILLINRTPIKKVPIVGGEAVDMFTLYQKVVEMGGFTKVCANFTCFFYVCVHISCQFTGCEPFNMYCLFIEPDYAHYSMEDVLQLTGNLLLVS